MYKYDIMSWYRCVGDIEMVICLRLCESHVIMGYDIFMMNIYDEYNCGRLCLG